MLSGLAVDEAQRKAGPRPYIGLRYFEESDAGLFYGRDEHTAELLGRVARDRFVAVLGSSGSGKSSLVRAGLLPELRSGMIPHAGPRWRVVEFKPGDAPLSELARALHSGLGVTNANELVQEGPLGIVHAVTAANLPENTNVLVIADQFEEVFRFQREQRDQGRESEAVEQCQALVRRLLDAGAQTAVPIYVLLAMRSDYLGECAQFYELPERISRSMYLIPRLRRDQVQEVITAPVGDDIEPALVQELLGKAGSDPDQLPRLQHLLNRVWTIAKGERLTLEHYVTAGGWEEALAENLNQVYANPLVPEKVCARLFQMLSDVDESNRVVRRRASLEELVEVCGPEVPRVISAFREEGFLRSGNPVDITHECILRNWDRVKFWLKKEIEARNFYREILARQKRDALLAGKDLTTAQKYLKSNQFSAEWARRYGAAAEFSSVVDFVANSALIEQRSTRKSRLLTYLLIGLALIVFVVCVAGAWMSWNNNRTIRAANAELRFEQVKTFRLLEQSRQSAEALIVAKVEDEKEKALAQKGESEAKKERLIAAAEAKRADAEAKRADAEVVQLDKLTRALQEYAGKNEAAHSTQSVATTESGMDGPKPSGPPLLSSSISARELAHLYNFPADLTGRGQTIALIELGGGYRVSDLQTYFGQLHLSIPSVSSVSVAGAKNQPGSGADAQVTADIEVAGSVVPGAHIVVYFAPNTNQGFAAAIAAATHDASHSPTVVSVGWGSPEQSWTSESKQAIDQALGEASSRGITVVASAGDSGVTDGLPGLRAVDFPASSPWVLACGGTRIHTANGQIDSETVWNDGQMGGATGGGVSDVFPRPEWQKNINVPLPASYASGALKISPGPRRAIPDVAANASAQSGYRIYVGGSYTVLGGTSIGTPFWAGLIALINQGLGHNVGFFNPVLYQTLGPAGVFHDITKGDNSFDKVVGYAAGPGWDAVSGWGSPDGAKLLEALKKLHH